MRKNFAGYYFRDHLFIPRYLRSYIHAGIRPKVKQLDASLFKVCMHRKSLRPTRFYSKFRT